MPLDDKQARFLERFFPGLIASVEQLGPGEFVRELPVLRRAPGSGLHGIGLHLTYKMKDGNSIAIKMSMRLNPGAAPYDPATDVPVLTNWQRFHYSMDYGPTFEDCFFRFDKDDISGHHVHIPPRTHDHILSESVIPDVRNIDPRDFVEMVVAYRKNRVCPVRKKS